MVNVIFFIQAIKASLNMLRMSRYYEFNLDNLCVQYDDISTSSFSLGWKISGVGFARAKWWCNKEISSHDRKSHF